MTIKNFKKQAPEIRQAIHNWMNKTGNPLNEVSTRLLTDFKINAAFQSFVMHGTRIPDSADRFSLDEGMLNRTAHDQNWQATREKHLLDTGQISKKEDIRKIPVTKKELDRRRKNSERRHRRDVARREREYAAFLERARRLDAAELPEQKPAPCGLVV
jgi:hypothetical protein